MTTAEWLLWTSHGYLMFTDPLSLLDYAIRDPSVPIERVIELAEERAALELCL